MKTLNIKLEKSGTGGRDEHHNSPETGRAMGRQRAKGVVHIRSKC